MNGEKELETVMECTLKYSFLEDSVGTTAEGEAESRLTVETLEVMPKYGEALFFSLRDIVDVKAADYRLELAVSSGEKLILYHLGYQFDDFLRQLTLLRNQMFIQDMLMQESLRESGMEGNCIFFNEEGEKRFEGKCEPRLYETALVVLPERGEPFRIPYSSLDNVEENDYTLTLHTEFGEKIIFSRMGRDFEPFTRYLSEIMNELSIKVQNSLKELLPGVSPAIIRKAARFMKEGKAARRNQLESLCPELWSSLENKLEELGIKHEYDYLSSMAQQDRMCIGFKRGLLGDLTGEYIWFLIPIYSLDWDRPGNVIAMEAGSGKGGGRATYFFTITSRKEYSEFDSIERLHAVAEDLLTKINRCMLAINFRREPIYLPEDRLQESRYQRYRIAAAKMPELQELRTRFIGRVFHRSPEQWEKDVSDLLKFNVSTVEEGAKWVRGSEHLEEEGEIFEE